LWFCIYLQALALEAAIPDASTMAHPAAVFEEESGIRKVRLANGNAQALGISAGLSVNAALALEPELVLGERSLRCEADLLNALAEWSIRFTAFTVIEAPSVLLLEIAGSLTLFGGIKALRDTIASELETKGHQAEIAIAPTPLAATWLARAGQKVCVRDAGNLAGKLAPLPLHCLNWTAAHVSALRGMGVVRVGELMRLPREGIAKRFGSARLLQLDRALGRMPDPRKGFRRSETFSAEQDLEQEEDNAELLLAFCEQLLKQLERFLRQRQLAAQKIEFIFFHLDQSATELSLGCIRAERSASHWFELLKIRFDSISLPAAVIAIRLSGGDSQRVSADVDRLPFAAREQRRQRASINDLAERLGARMGNEAVHGIVNVADYRPGCAWQRQDAFSDVPNCRRSPLPEAPRTVHRPLWMLETPERLVLDHKVPVYQGRLTLLNGPERLETGWWDEEGIARDYFVARNAAGVQVWIFRNRDRDRYWFLHGIFG